MNEARYSGMTLNERLFDAGLLNQFDEALSAGDLDGLIDLLIAVDADTSLATTLLGESYACWLCGESIEKAKGSALKIGLKDLWNTSPDAEPTQIIYAHFDCAEKQISGPKMLLEHDILFPDEENP